MEWTEKEKGKAHSSAEEEEDEDEEAMFSEFISTIYRLGPPLPSPPVGKGEGEIYGHVWETNFSHFLSPATLSACSIIVLVGPFKAALTLPGPKYGTTSFLTDV